MRSEYSWIPAGESAGRTEPNQVGVSFSEHRAAVYESDGRTDPADNAAGAVFVAGVATQSPFHFARAFKTTTGLAPHQFVTARRVDRAKALLLGSKASVVDAAHAVGLSNVSHFRRVFRAHLGVSPGAIRGR